MASTPAASLLGRSHHLLLRATRQRTPSSSLRSTTILAPGPGQERPSQASDSELGQRSAIVEPDSPSQSDGASGSGSKPRRDATAQEGDPERSTISMAGPTGRSGDTPLDRIINAMPGPSTISAGPAGPSPENGYQGSSSHPFASIPLTKTSSATSNPTDLPYAPMIPSPTSSKIFARPPPQHPFDTHAFVRHMESSSFAAGASRALMRATEGMVVRRSGRAVGEVLHKEDIENAAYLFAAALSELRTELSVRARNDGLALRSTSSLIRREVDALGQRVKEDIGTLKHDIEMDMNNRKAETRTEQKGYDIAIEEINNKFTISIGDLKTEIEQAKWDATRRAITIIAGIVFSTISIITLSGDKPAPPPAPKSLPAPGSSSTSSGSQARMRDMGVGTNEDDDAALLERLEGLAALGRERAVAAAISSGSATGTSGLRSSGFAAGDERF